MARPTKYDAGWREEHMSTDTSKGSHQCKRCGLYGDAERAFYSNNKNPHVCRYCWAKDGRERRQRDPEAERFRVREWRARTNKKEG